eukprot:scaffold25985_cov67-Phaeocystis_antarctica.AAC.1
MQNPYQYDVNTISPSPRHLKVIGTAAEQLRAHPRPLSTTSLAYFTASVRRHQWREACRCSVAEAAARLAAPAEAAED